MRKSQLVNDKTGQLIGGLLVDQTVVENFAIRLVAKIAMREPVDRNTDRFSRPIAEGEMKNPCVRTLVVSSRSLTIVWLGPAFNRRIANHAALEDHTAPTMT